MKIKKTIDEAVAFYTENSKETKSCEAEEGVENLSHIPHKNNQWKKQNTVAVPKRFITYVNKYSEILLKFIQKVVFYG